LVAITSYLEVERAPLYIKSLYYEKGHAIVRAFSPADKQEIQKMFPDSQLPQSFTPSKQFVQRGKSFALGDNVSIRTSTKSSAQYISFHFSFPPSSFSFFFV